MCGVLKAQIKQVNIQKTKRINLEFVVHDLNLEDLDLTFLVPDVILKGSDLAL